MRQPRQRRGQELSSDVKRVARRWRAVVLAAACSMFTIFPTMAGAGTVFPAMKSAVVGPPARDTIANSACLTTAVRSPGGFAEKPAGDDFR